MTDNLCKFYVWKQDDKGQFICTKHLTDHVACMWVFGPMGAPKYAQCSGNSSDGEHHGNDKKDDNPVITRDKTNLGGISNTVNNEPGINNNGINDDPDGNGGGKDTTSKGDNNSNIGTPKIIQVLYNYL